MGRPEARELGPVHAPARHGGKRARAGPARASCRAWAAPQARGPARPGTVSVRPDSPRGPAREHEARQPEPAGHIRGRGRPRALVTLAPPPFPALAPPWLRLVSSALHLPRSSPDPLHASTPSPRPPPSTPPLRRRSVALRPPPVARIAGNPRPLHSPPAWPPPRLLRLPRSSPDPLHPDLHPTCPA